MRRNDVYWQRLRKDCRSNIAALLAVIAALAATLSLISVVIDGAHYQSRQSPLYWLLMVPTVWWVAGVSRFEALQVRLWVPVVALASGVSVAVALIAMRTTGTWTIQTIACAATVVSTGVSLLLYRGSLVQREGPAH